jgi:3-isopropylmalate dehydratase small subunit
VIQYFRYWIVAATNYGEGSSRENFAWRRGHEDFRKDVARRFQTLAGDVCMNLMGLGDPGEREARAHQQISE